ncbi:platelet-activating factor receptor [Conger conger]|uniref:platelet-activating factor receptor n=1 Tax=Conger conger TaxID=82655 RepID=UPI002A5A07E6|nr:platelet-activating factor receptor [Conger conger]XP_061075914.1 platelet-activating factor receptor [Conger conger]
MSGPDVSGPGNGSFLDSEFRYNLFTVFYSLVFIVGLVANVGALYVLRHLRDAKAMNEIRIYMTNLTVADLLFVCALPFWISYYYSRGHWRFGEALCRVTGSLFFINTYSSVLFLAIISFNRYWAVTRPLDAVTSDHRRRGILMSLGVWVVTLSMSGPQLAQNGMNSDDAGVVRCFENYVERDETTRMTVAAMHFVIIGLFFLVFLLVVVCNVLIGRTLLQQRQTLAGRKRWGLKKYALWMVCVVVLVFMVCFLPHHVVQGPWTLAVLGYSGMSDSTRQRLNDAHQFTTMLMGLNCIMDPVVYCFSTRKFRHYVSSRLGFLSRAKDCSVRTNSTKVSLNMHRQGVVAPLEMAGEGVRE